MLEHNESRFLIEEILATNIPNKTINVYQADLENHLESTTTESIETVLVIKPDDQSLWSFWLHKSLGLSESQTLSLANIAYSPGTLKLKAAMHLPAEAAMNFTRLLLSITQ